MNISKSVWIVGVLLALLAGACAPAATPAPLPTEPAPATTVPPSPEPPTAVPSPTLVPVNLAGPSTGSEMAWTDGSVLQFVPAGEFVMGSGLPDAPQRTVYLDDYWIYKTEVTNSMYAFCVSVGACAAPAQVVGAPVYDNPAFANYPVVGVTWDMAANYCAWVGGSLPTEAQWEKAARGPQGQPYPWGNEEASCDQGNFAGCIGGITNVNRYAESASPYGVLDMAGNVFEWVNDYYAEDYYSSAPAENPAGPESGEFRAVRGSGYETGVEQASAAVRRPAGTGYTSPDLGFRCVVQEPPAYAPMCQTSSYVPSAVVSSGECQVPDVNVGASYCEFNRPFTTVDLAPGATFEVLTDGYECAEAVIDGQRRLSCSGPDGTTGEVTVCNTACSNVPDVTGATQVCDPGYSLDPDTGTCLYAPASPEVGVSGCPAGYVMIDRGSQATCAPGLAGDGLCPDGMYFDTEYGACASPAAGAELPIGLDAPERASETYQGCLQGFTYSPEFQCCQPEQGGAYPGCPLGTSYDATAQTCVPDQRRLSGPGCVTVSVNMLQCTAPFQINICSKINTETGCIRNQVYDCRWNESAGACEYVP